MWEKQEKCRCNREDSCGRKEDPQSDILEEACQIPRGIEDTVITTEEVRADVALVLWSESEAMEAPSRTC